MESGVNDVSWPLPEMSIVMVTLLCDWTAAAAAAAAESLSAPLSRQIQSLIRLYDVGAADSHACRLQRAVSTLRVTSSRYIALQASLP